MNGETRRGFRFYVGGGLGAVPHAAKLLDEFVTEEELLSLAEAGLKCWTAGEPLGAYCRLTRAALRLASSADGADSERHSREDLDIRPGLYDLWLAALLQAVAGCDPEHTPQIEVAWRDTLSAGIEYMRSRY